MSQEPTAEQVEQTLVWIDTIPLSRPKKNLHRDFSDGVLMAEILKQFYPKLVELHNYSAASAVDRKAANWITLNNKVWKKIGMPLTQSDIDAVSNSHPGTIERILVQLHKKITDAFSQHQNIQENQPKSSAQSSVGELRSNSVAYASDGKASSDATAAKLHEMEEKYEKLLYEKEQTNIELRETIEILEAKISKLEQLVRIKDTKINALTSKVHGTK